MTPFLHPRWWRVFGLAMVGIAQPVFSQTLLIVDNPAEKARDASMAFTADAFVANDHVPLRDFDQDPWPSDYRVRSGRNASLLSTRLALGASYRGINIDYLRRSDWLLQASGDTAHAYFISQTDQLITSGRNLEIDYRLRGFEADGFRIGVTAQLPLESSHSRTWLGMSANFLRGLRLRSEETHATYTSNGSAASLNGQREIWYSELKPAGNSGSISAFLPFEEESVPAHGAGRSFDVGVLHETNSGWRISISANDLAGKLKWSNLPHVQQNIAVNNATTSSFTSTGTPVLSGFNDYRDYTLRLPVKYKFVVSGKISDTTAGFGEVTRIAGIDFPRFGLEWRLDANQVASVDMDTRWHTVGVSGRWQHFQLGLRTDSLKLSTARALGVGGSFIYPF